MWSRILNPTLYTYVIQKQLCTKFVVWGRHRGFPLTLRHIALILHRSVLLLFIREQTVYPEKNESSIPKWIRHAGGFWCGEREREKRRWQWQTECIKLRETFHLWIVVIKMMVKITQARVIQGSFAMNSWTQWMLLTWLDVYIKTLWVNLPRCTALKHTKSVWKDLKGSAYNKRKVQQ